jgi:hypothetical protein
MAMRHAALAHIVLGMDLEPADTRRVLQDIRHVFGFEPDPYTLRNLGGATPSGMRGKNGVLSLMIGSVSKDPQAGLSP